MSIPPALASASVFVVRDGRAAPEVLLVRRNTKIAFHGGSWVFPGGKVDAVDRTAETGGDAIEIARRTAAREAREETGVVLDGRDLAPFSHWTTPETQPKRFATWIFFARVSVDTEVVIDRSEIIDYRWLAVADALEQRASDEIQLPAPMFVSLTKLGAFQQAAAIADHVNGGEVERFVPRIVELDEGRAALYQEDAGYRSLDLSAEGARHRLMMMKSGWEYLNNY